MIRPDNFRNACDDPALHAWRVLLPQQIARAFAEQTHGDLPAWQAALDELPPLSAASIDLRDSVRIGTRDDLVASARESFVAILHRLRPWRKGPIELFGMTIDTEWRSDWKWQRLLPHIQSLKDRLVLDVGCGNGYYALRMLGAGARRVIGIDPAWLFVMQHQALRRYLPDLPAQVLPLGIDDVPENLHAFDTVFSMGVLYHRHSPLKHLAQLQGALRRGGELVLETLVVEGDAQTVLLPIERYARMRNVWFIPSCAAMEVWLTRAGFHDIRCVDVSVTTPDEQRRTEWMPFESLAESLDPQDSTRTIEAYPAPTRAVFTAVAP